MTDTKAKRKQVTKSVRFEVFKRDALEAGADLEWIEELAKSACNWTEFKQELTEAAQ
jgi:hypothetical protein